MLVRLKQPKYAWLVKYSEYSEIHYLLVTQEEYRVTTNINEATKFADKKSAEAAIEGCNCGGKVVEHCWPDGF